MAAVKGSLQCGNLTSSFSFEKEATSSFSSVNKSGYHLKHRRRRRQRRQMIPKLEPNTRRAANQGFDSKIFRSEGHHCSWKSANVEPKWEGHRHRQ
ncbi:hypothetical protein Lser_V15G41865 [Lactuca serriola]